MNKNKIYSMLATSVIVSNTIATPIIAFAEESNQPVVEQNVESKANETEIEKIDYSTSFVENESIISTEDSSNTVVDVVSEKPTEQTTEQTSEDKSSIETVETATSNYSSTEESNTSESKTSTEASSNTETKTLTTETSTSEETKKENKTSEESKPVVSETKAEKPKTINSIEEKPEVKHEVSTSVNINVSNISYGYDFNNDTAKFISSIAEQARVIGDKNGIYASVMIAQAILESGSGSSELSKAPYNNIFGIKGSYNGQYVEFNTMEDDGSGNLYQIVDSFRKYNTSAESLEDYADLIKNSGYYEGSWKQNAPTYVEAAQYLQGRYATDTSYAAKLIGLIETYDLQQYDEKVNYEKAQYNENGVQIEGDKIEKASDDTIVKLLSTATSQLGVPYVWGGTTLDQGLDCSGFVQQVYAKALGIQLPRVTTEQERVGEFVDVDVNKLQPGDLVFFGSQGSTHHVGLYLSNGYFIHAPVPGRTVEIENIKNFTPDFAKRIIPTVEN